MVFQDIRSTKCHQDKSQYAGLTLGSKLEGMKSKVDDIAVAERE